MPASTRRPRQSSVSTDARRSRRLFSRSTSHQPSPQSTPLHSTMSLPPATRRRFLSRSSSRPPRRVFARLSQPRRTNSPSPPHKQTTQHLFEPHTSDISDSASNDANPSPSNPDLVFIDDVPHIKFCNVGEEEEPLIPDLSTPYFSKPSTKLSSNDPLNNLSLQNEQLAQENETLLRKNAALQAELDSIRSKATTLSSELATLNRQHDDIRAKFSRRIRHLEAQLHSVNSTTTSRSRTSNQPILDTQSHQLPSRAFDRVQSLGSVSESSRRRSIRMSAIPVPPTNPQRRALEGDTNVASPASRARQSLIRRAFVAHIHAHRYRNARQAWVQFLKADHRQVTLSTFSGCVRELAVAAEASDRELQLQMQEICEVPVGPGTVMTWNMFVRFYNNTKNDTT